MTEIDPKALAAAGEVYLSEQVEMQAPGQLDWATSELSSAIQAYLDAADLVPRSDYKMALKRAMLAVKERDEARAQIAALRKVCVRALQDVRSGYVLKATESIKAALTDTAKAAEGWQRVDDEHVLMPLEPTNRIIEYLYGSFISASAHASRIEAYKNAMQLVPNPEAGEGTG